MPQQFGGGPLCEVCEKPVFFNEERKLKGVSYHTTCFKCIECNKTLESTTVAEHNDELHCKNCHRKKFGPKGFGYGANLCTDSGQSEKQQSKPANPRTAMYGGGGDTCPRCEKTVYHAEKVNCMNKVWHKKCLRCALCEHVVDSRTAREHDGDLFCQSCYGREFGPKGYGFGGGAGTLSMEGSEGQEERPKEKKETSPNPLAAKFGGTTDTCPRCGKAVYHAEKVELLNEKWHKTCLKCASCNRALDSRNVRDHDGELYCANCHSKEFGTKGYGYGVGAGTLAVDQEGSEASPKIQKRATSPNPLAAKFGGATDTCPRCNKAVYHAEKVECLGKKWHKYCLKCASCNRSLDSRTVRDHDGELYCASCHSREFGTKGYGYGVGAGTLSMDNEDKVGSPKAQKRITSHNPLAAKFGGAADSCPRCNKAVYHAEKVECLGKKWHKHCLTCASCSHSLDSRTVRDHDGELYCASCHSREFGTKGYGYGVGAGTLSMDHEGNGGSPQVQKRATSPNPLAAKFGGASDTCPRCNKAVYHAEKVECLGKKWHKYCLKCVSCKHSLDSRTVRDHEGELYCASCHSREFGTKGYGYGVGAGALAMDHGDSSSPQVKHRTTAPNPLAAKFGGRAETCPRCNKAVYHAEQVECMNKKWHKHCLNCVVCGHHVDSRTARDHAGELFCATCHTREFGTKGYGYGSGAGTLSMEGGGIGDESNHRQSSSPNPLASMFGGGGSICPRCDKKVYLAEEVDLLDQKWHRACLKCAACNHTIDARTVREHDHELFCQSCYSREFGPKGYGYGGGADGANNHEEDGMRHNNHHHDDEDDYEDDHYDENDYDDDERNYRPSSPAGKTNALAAKFGGSADECPRCKKPVYYAEKADCLGKRWHQGCLKCLSCEHPVDSRTAREHDDELYCATCYAKDFGPHGYGYSGGAGGLSMEGATATRDISAETFCAPLNDSMKGMSVSDGPKPRWGGAVEKCFRCGNNVYHAEMAQGAGEVYHKSCLKCKECNKMLEAGTFSENEGEVFCKSCYGRLYGPKGYGYGAGAGALTVTQ